MASDEPELTVSVGAGWQIIVELFAAGRTDTSLDDLAALLAQRGLHVVDTRDLAVLNKIKKHPSRDDTSVG